MTKKWNLWIDDIRDPRYFAKHDWKEKEFIWATNIGQAEYFCELWGPPQYMALDHDLGYDPNVMCKRCVPEFLSWLQSNYPNSPPEFRIHTANPEGGRNMRAFMESWRKSLNLP